MTETKLKCLNPKCGAEFEPSHYGKRQRICGVKACKKWYKEYYSQVRQPPRGIDDEVFARLLKAARPDRLKHAFLVVARASGLRKGELLGLTWADILDHKGKIKAEIEIRGQWRDRQGFQPTKTRNSRLGYLTEKAKKALEEVQDSQKNTDRVFPFWNSGIWSWFNQLQRQLRIANPETGYPYRVHDIRHSLGLELAHKKGRLDVAKQMLGHKNIQTTTIYSQPHAGEFLKTVEKLTGAKPKRQKVSKPKARKPKKRRRR